MIHSFTGPVKGESGGIIVVSATDLSVIFLLL